MSLLLPVSSKNEGNLEARTLSASLGFPGPISSGMGAKKMYKMPITRAPANAVKIAVAIFSFIVAPPHDGIV
jgi:hypothetical protein